MTGAPKRVVVWGTGFVGRMVIPEIVRHPAFELVGVGVSAPEKVGRDAGEICGIGPVGVTATDDVDALVALRPDALVHYGPTAAHAGGQHRAHEHVPPRRDRRLLDVHDPVGLAGDGAEPAVVGRPHHRGLCTRAGRRASPPASIRVSPTTSSP